MITLPDGFVSELGTVFNKAKVGGLTGKQQNYLADIKNLEDGIHYIDLILEDLVQNFYSTDGQEFKNNKKDALKRISISDIETLLINIRKETYDNIYFMEDNCTHCNTLNKMKLDLASLEVTESPKDKKGKYQEVTLPKSGRKAKLRLMGLEDLHKSFSMFKNSKSELVTTTATLVLKSLDNKEDPTSKDVETLPIMDIKFINDEYSKIGGKVDTDIIHNCTKCKQDFTAKLNVISPNFFSLS